MHEQYLLGIDMGTSSVKVGLVSPKGKLVRVDSEPYPMDNPHPGWVEQEPDNWWESVIIAVQRVVEGLNPQKVVAIGFSNAGGSMVLLNEKRKHIRPAIVWMDTRAIEQGERLLHKHGQNFWVNRTGQISISYWPIAKLLWLLEHEPKTHKNIFAVLQGSDYIIFRMTEQIVTDRSNACATGVYNLSNGTWDSEILSLISLSESVMPKLVDPGSTVGHLTKHAASELGLCVGTPVVSGAWDQACAVVGAGSVSGKDALLSAGTAWVLSNPISELRFDIAARGITSHHAVPGEYLFMIPMSNGGSVIEWYRTIFAGSEGFDNNQQHKNNFLGIPTGVEHVPPGSEGVLFLPHLVGAAGPHWEPDYSGGFLGLRHGTTKAQIFRAILEAVAYETRWSLKVLAELGFSPTQLRMSGGSTKNPIWPQIVADVTGLEVLIPRQTECTVIGAAMLARIGAGFGAAKGKDVNEIDRLLKPNREVATLYRFCFETYQRLHRSTKEIHASLSTLRGN